MASCCALAPAKVNLFLGVELNKAADGRHNLQTIYHCLELADTLHIDYDEATAKQGISCSCIPAINGLNEQDNLAYKAAELMCKHFGKMGQLNIRIEKRIPTQAGLGGGSSDAAAVLKALASLWGVEDRREELLKLASQLGSDVSCFLYDEPVLMGGVGDSYEESFKPLSASVLIIKPDQGVDTAEAYRRFDERPDRVMPNDLMLIGMREGDLELVASHIANNLELAVASLLPEISVIQAWLGAQKGSINPHVSGSGSAVFALFESYEEAEEARRGAEQKGWLAVHTKLADHGVVIQELA